MPFLSQGRYTSRLTYEVQAYLRTLLLYAPLSLHVRDIKKKKKKLNASLGIFAAHCT